MSLQQDERIHDELKNSRHSQTLILGNCWIHSLTATSVISHILSGEGIFADSMQKLRRLDLSQNAITEIPPSISILTNLREVYNFYFVVSIYLCHLIKKWLNVKRKLLL